MSQFIPVIGLEVHVELKTHSKMFCSCPADYFGKKPNTHTCPVCLGLPGALPVPNKQAIDWCIKIALALDCEIAKFSKFDRKNYFYPDLPKGYQISQYDLPFGKNGHITLANGKKIGITRVHMEEDTGKLTHKNGNSIIDFNRSSVPLVEIVTEPDFDNASDVKEYLQELQQIVRYVDVSDADMEKGNMRLEPNISLKKQSEKTLPKYKVEVKNINSFRFVEKAIAYELKRQENLLQKNETPKQETRGWNETKNATVSQRSKEEAQDYRYFPEPDIPPIRISAEQIAKVKETMPELPSAVRKRFITQYSLTEYDAEILTREKQTADYYEKLVAAGKKHDISPKQIANAIINKKITGTNIEPEICIKQFLKSTQTVTIDDVKLLEIMQQIIAQNQKAVTDYNNGKTQAITFLVGMVMRKLGVKADAAMIKQKLETLLAK